MFTAQVKPRHGKSLMLIPVEMIVPNQSQPRHDFDENELAGLAESIRKNGILQPLTIRKCKDGKFELIAGERRLRAAKMAGLLSVPCLEMEVDDRRSALLSLLENLQRQDLTYFEEAEGISKLITEWGVTQQEAAQRLGMAQSTIANKIRLLRLPDTQRKRIADARLTERHARALLRLQSDEVRESVITEIITKGLNVTETDRLIDHLLIPATPAPAKRAPLIRDVRLFINTLSRAVDTMRLSGLDAKAAKTETEDYIEYTVLIPKSQARRKGATKSMGA